MRILILHQNKFERMAYDRAIDHAAHDVTYAGGGEYIANIPPDVRCEKFTWDTGRPVADQLMPWMAGRAPFDRIITRHEALIIPAASLRENLGVPGMRLAAARNFRDKVAMKETLDRAGVRVPRFVPVDELGREVPWQGKTIVKPRGGRGSQGVKLFDTSRAALAFIESRRADDGAGHRFDGDHELEEYVAGPIWHVDGYLFEGRPIVIQASRYIGTCLGFEGGVPLGSVQYANPELEEWAVECLRALGGTNLTFHLEAIMTPSGPVFLEVAARCGGAYVVDTVEHKHGLYLHTLDMASDVESKLAARFAEKKTTSLMYGWFLYPGRQYDGAPCAVSVPGELLEDPRLVKYTMLPPGTATTRHHSYRPEDLPFAGLVAATDSDAVDAWIRDLFAEVTITPRSSQSAMT